MQEADKINCIKDKYSIDLEPMHESYYKNIDTSNFSFFEKALILREYANYHPNIDKTCKGELDNFIHLNDRLIISLDPFKYTICSPYIYDLVTKYINGVVNVKE